MASPFLVPAAMSGLSALFGAMNRPQDPYQQILAQMQKWANPQQVGQDTNSFFQQFLGGGAFGAGKQAALGASNNIRSQLQSRLGGSGLGAAGIGQAAASLGNSALAPMLQQLYAGGWQGAQGQAQNLLQSRLQGLNMAGMPGQNSVGNALFGAGMGGLGDVLKWYMQSKMPVKSSQYSYGPQ